MFLFEKQKLVPPQDAPYVVQVVQKILIILKYNLKLCLKIPNIRFQITALLKKQRGRINLHTKEYLISFFSSPGLKIRLILQ